MNLQKKFSYPYLTCLCICLLLTVTMLFRTDAEVAGFPVYTLFLFLIMLMWLAGRVVYADREGQTFLSIHCFADTVSAITILCAVGSILGKLFRNPEEGAIDFSWNAEVIALALICLLVSAGIQFRFLYLEVIMYSGLLVSGMFLLTYFTDIKTGEGINAMFSDSGMMASCFMLIGMIGVYGYCAGRDRLRSLFCFCVSGIAFFALFLNKNVVSLWLMAVYFLAVPVVLCPTAALVKRVMQMFFLYGFMLSNMSLLTEFTNVLYKEVSYAAELSVYLDLLLASGGIAFFRYWDRIPVNVDMERLVLRRMQKKYRFLLKITLILFFVIILGAGGWNELTGKEGVGAELLQLLAVPLAEEAGRGKGAFLYCVENTGVVSGIFAIFYALVLGERMRMNYREEKGLTSILILVSAVFLLQLLFWNPGIHNTVVYFFLSAAACFYQEEYRKTTGVRVNADELSVEIQEIK